MLSRPNAWAVAIVGTLTMTVSYIDRATLAVLAPSVTKALDISETGFGLLASAFSIAYLVATPISGWWIDRIGARRGLVRSVLAWSTVAALQAIVPGFATLFALRIALGLAEGPGFPGAAQTIQRVLPPASRARGFGLLFTGSSIGTMIAAPLASTLYGHAGWRLAFVGTALVGLAWVPLWILVTRPPELRARLDVAHAAAGPRPRFAMLARHPLVLRGLIGVFAAAPVTGFIATWGSKYLVREFALRQEQVGSYLWLPPLVFDVGALAFGDLASRLPRAPGAPPRALHAGAMVLASTLALLPFASTPWEAMIVLGIANAGGGGLYTLCASDLLARMPPQAVSFAGGILAGAQSLAFIIVNPLIGYGVDQHVTYGAISAVIGAWAIPGSLIWIAWRPQNHLELNV